MIRAALHRTRREIDRAPELEIRIRKTERLRQHADYFVAVTAQLNLSADYARIGAKSLLPERVGQNCYKMPARLLFFGQKRPAYQRLNTQYLEEAGRNDTCVDAHRLVDATHIKRGVHLGG